MDLDKCLKEVASEISSFLKAEGGYENGYYSCVTGEVLSDKPGHLKWTTPKAEEELTEKGKLARGEKLYKELQETMKVHGVDRLLIRSKDIEFGSMQTEVVYIVETKCRVNLW